MKLSTLKPYVEQVPRAAAAYYALRDVWTAVSFAPEVTKHGFRFAGDPSMIDGSFEPTETAFVIESLPAIDVFVDVGANIGFYACLARSRGIRTIAVEPHPTNLKFLYGNLNENGWRDAEIFPVGLGASPGLVELHGGGTGASLIEGWAGASRFNSRLIPLLTLDLVAGQRLQPLRSLIKIDVEGAESELLEGATLTLRSPRATWLIEVCLAENHPAGMNPQFSQVFEKFWSTGYRAFTLTRPRREITREDVQRWVKNRVRDFGSYNVVFTRDDLSDSHVTVAGS